MFPLLVGNLGSVSKTAWGSVWVHHLSLSSGPLTKWRSPDLEFRATAEMVIRQWRSGSVFFPTAHLHISTNKCSLTYINKQWKTGLATAGMKICGNSRWNSGDELKLYLRRTGSTLGTAGSKICYILCQFLVYSWTSETGSDWISPPKMWTHLCFVCVKT